MNARKRIVLLSILISSQALFAACCESYAQQPIPYEGRWAKSKRECRPSDRPDSKTLIDFKDAKSGPLFDQYENHCKIVKTSAQGAAYKLDLMCFEFWDNFDKGTDGRRTFVTLSSISAQSMAINGARYVRCAQSGKAAQ